MHRRAPSLIRTVLADTADPAQLDDLRLWFRAHLPEMVDSDAAADPSHTGGTYLALYESRGDPLEAVEAYSRDHRPGLKAAGRLSDIIEITWRGIYRTLAAAPPS